VSVQALSCCFRRISLKPSEQCVGCDGGRDLSEPASAQPLCGTGQPTPLGIREPQAFPTELIAENPVLLLQILDHLVLVSAQPSGEKNDQELQTQGRHRETLARPTSCKNRLGSTLARNAQLVVSAHESDGLSFGTLVRPAEGWRIQRE